MDKNALGDLYLIAENLAQDSSLVPEAEKEFDPPLRGVLTEAEVLRQAEVLDNMDIDSYIEAVVSNAEDPKRIPAPDVIRRLGEVVSEDRDGPFYAAEVTMDFDGEPRRIGFIAQNRSVRSGEWMPEHHLQAAHAIVEFANRSIPIVSLMDTPGAAGDEIANKNNQSHSISRLIAEMS
ncbi:MAG: carbamoyl-phosphate synthase large subunit, partial [Gammaproteobacteria bacterium]|nr:carbamoyl-phosphate synthase large subunit [Gammaproteobacteria bacterium]